MKALLLIVLRFYRRAVSPMLPPACRFQPTCSRYAIEAIETHGSIRGSWLAAKRVAKCHPLHSGGYDPVPARPDTLLDPADPTGST